MTKQYSNRAVCRMLATVHPGFDRKLQADNYATGACKYAEARFNGYWTRDGLATEDYFLTLRREGWPVKLAGALATRLWEAVQVQPLADQLLLVTMENGNRFSAPAGSVDLTSGYTSGSLTREALLIDVRNLRERAQRLIDDHAELVGQVDDD